MVTKKRLEEEEEGAAAGGREEVAARGGGKREEASKETESEERGGGKICEESEGRGEEARAQGGQVKLLDPRSCSRRDEASRRYALYSKCGEGEARRVPFSVPRR